MRRVSLKRDNSTLLSVCRKMISHGQAAVAQLLHERRHLGEIAGPAARVQADADVLERRVFARHDLVDERLQQRDGNVIDAVEAEILEHVEGHALAGARDAADDHEPQRFPPCRGAGLNDNAPPLWRGGP